MKITLYLIASLLLMFQSTCFSQRKIHWKIYDQNFNSITEVKTQDISIVDNLIWYKTEGKYGVMDMNNNILIQPKYDEIYHHKAGFTAVGSTNCYGMVYKGKEILPLEYSNQFVIDTIGYVKAEKGCSEDDEAYIITTSSIHDRTGKLMSQKDLDDQPTRITWQYEQKHHDKKTVSNGFTLKAGRSNLHVKKSIYNRKDSLIFSCIDCHISDNVNGEFFIHQSDSTKSLDYESYAIDTFGRVKIRSGYDQLYYYDQKYKGHLYERGREKGRVDVQGREKAIAYADVLMGIEVISPNRFLISATDSLKTVMSTICDSLGVHLFIPTKDKFWAISNNCLIRKTPMGYVFTDANGESVSNVYDSLFVIPNFNYESMVLQETRISIGSCLVSSGALDRDGFSPVMDASTVDFYGIFSNGEMGIFDVERHLEIQPHYTLVARVNTKLKLFVVRKDKQWFTMNDNSELKSHGKGRYINFSENYLLIGD